MDFSSSSSSSSSVSGLIDLYESVFVAGNQITILSLIAICEALARENYDLYSLLLTVAEREVTIDKDRDRDRGKEKKNFINQTLQRIVPELRGILGTRFVKNEDNSFPASSATRIGS
jgi:hypothetical protein